MTHPVFVRAVERIYTNRKEEGLTDQEIYREVGISRSYFYKIKKNFR